MNDEIPLQIEQVEQVHQGDQGAHVSQFDQVPIVCGGNDNLVVTQT